MKKLSIGCLGVIGSFVLIFTVGLVIAGVKGGSEVSVNSEINAEKKWLLT